MKAESLGAALLPLSQALKLEDVMLVNIAEREVASVERALWILTRLGVVRRGPFSRLFGMSSPCLAFLLPAARPASLVDSSHAWVHT